MSRSKMRLSPEDLTDSEAKEYLELLSKQSEARKASPISFYDPHPGQRVFHESEKRIRCLEAGNRGGKSTAGINEDIATSLGYRPWLPETSEHYLVKNSRGDPIRVPNVGIIAGESFKTAIRETLYPKVKEWCPASIISREAKNQQGVVERIEFKNGSVIRFMAYNQDPKEFESASYDFVHYDEPPPQSIFEATQRGLIDYSGKCWFTMTPLREPWIYSTITSRAGIDPNIDHFNFDSDLNPHISKRDLDAYFSIISDPAIRTARRHGRWLHLTGLVYPEFQTRPPFWIKSFVPKRPWVRIMGIDPHPRKPVACLWVAISTTTGQWYAYRELFDPDLRKIDAVADRILYLERDEEISYRVIDPSSREDDRTVEFSIYDQFANEGIFCDLAQRHDKLGGIELVHQLLKIHSLTMKPSLQVMDNCPHLRHEFQNHVWDDWAISRTRSDRDPKPQVRKKDDDLLDILRYLRQAGRWAEDFSPRAPRGLWSSNEGDYIDAPLPTSRGGY